MFGEFYSSSGKELNTLGPDYSMLPSTATAPEIMGSLSLPPREFLICMCPEKHKVVGRQPFNAGRP